MKKLIFIQLILSVTLLCNAQQTINASISHGGLTRNYLLYVPAGYNSNTPAPLVLCFHGYTSYAVTIMNYSGFNSIADNANFIVAYPQGTLLGGYTHWNVAGLNVGSTVDDLGFASALIDSISSEYNIDETMIYSTGMSNGGYMSFYLACQLSDRIAAIASVTGSMTPQVLNTCNPQHPTPVMQIHGNSDATVPYAGDTWTLSINNVLDYWASYNNCSTSPSISAMPDINTLDGSTVEHHYYPDGDSCSSVEHYKVFGGGHDWPGAWGNMDISSSALIWDFLSKHTINGLILCSSIGIDEISQSLEGLKIYPKPTNSVLTVDLDFKGVINFEILSLMGQRVSSGTITAGSKQIDISGLSPDVYILRIENQSFKILKTD